MIRDLDKLKAYYEYYLDKFSILGRDLNSVIYIYIMDLHYVENHDKVIKIFKKFIVVYTPYFIRRHPQILMRYCYCLVSRQLLFNSELLMQGIFREFNEKIFAFYRKDIKIIKSYLPITNMIVCNFDHVIFYTSQSYNIIANFDEDILFQFHDNRKMYIKFNFYIK